MANWSVAHLKRLCKNRGLTGYSKLNKAELIALCAPEPPKIIGRGGYGCIYSPPLACDANNANLGENVILKVTEKINTEEDLSYGIYVQSKVANSKWRHRYILPLSRCAKLNNKAYKKSP